MKFARTNDGQDLFYEVTGTGIPIIFVHEFAGDHRSWEPQVRHFSKWFCCVTFNARGYPPSSVPTGSASYSQARAVADILAVMDHAEIEKAHIVGLSMGGFAALHLGLQQPNRTHSVCVAGVGYGAEPDRNELFRKECDIAAAFLLENGMEAFAQRYSTGPTRLPFKHSDPRGFAEFQKQMAEHSALGSANTQMGVQRERPSLYSLNEEFEKMSVPTLILNGDEDAPCLAPGLMLKAKIPSSALSVIANCGHTINLEASNEFNRIVGDFISRAESGRWPHRGDGDIHSKTITGMSHLADRA